MARILVVDDDPVSRGILRGIMEGSRHVVEEAPDGVQAMKAYRRAPFDLVITDIFMPEKEGVELVREMRQEFPGARIIAVSGGSSSARFDSLDWIKAFGVSHTFTKPFDRLAILAAVDELLSAKP